MKYLISLLVLAFLTIACTAPKIATLDGLSPEPIEDNPDIGTMTDLPVDTGTNVDEVQEIALPEIPDGLVEDDPDLGDIGDIPVVSDDLI